MRACSDHDKVNHTGYGSSSVLNGFFIFQLSFARAQVNRGSSELSHACLKGNAGAGAGFFKKHRQHFSFKGTVNLPGLETRLEFYAPAEKVI